MSPSDEAFIIHDGAIILQASPEFYRLFRGGPTTFVDARVESILSGADYRALAHWRGPHMMAAMEDDHERAFIQDYEFIRCDGSRFWGKAHSKRYVVEREYITVVKWEYDIHEPGER